VQDGEDGIIVKLSDGTIGGYVLEELLELRPAREQIKSLEDNEWKFRPSLVPDIVP